MGRKYDLTAPPKGNKNYTSDQTSPEVTFQAFEVSGVRHSTEADSAKKVEKVGFFRLFRFADRLDYLLMFVGLLAGIGHGTGAQLNLLVLSNTLDKFVEDSRKNETADSGSGLMDDIGIISRNFVLVATLVLVCGYVHMMCWCLTSERQIRVIRDLAFRSVLKQHIGWFDRHQSGELNTRLTSDINSIHGGIGDKVATFIQWTSTFVAGAVICLIRGWKLTLAMLAITPVGIGVGAFVAWSLQKYANKELQTYATAGAVSEEALGNIRTVTAYSGHEREASRYTEHLEAARKVGVQRGLVTGAGQGVFWMVVFGTIAFGFWFGSVLIQQPGEEMSVGILMQVVMSLVTGVRALSFGVNNLDNFSMARAGATVIYGLIDSVSEIDSSSTEGKKPAEFRGNVKLQGVRFAYPSRPDTMILDGLDLDIRPGQTVALVGPSGCGKSTIVQLIQRFYDPNFGKVRLDDLDVRELNIRWLRQQIGVVSQEPVLFATSIKENIRFGKDGATQAEIEQAAKEANAHNFIMNLPEKYDTPVGSKGTQLSGGQKQRIAIARALIRNPKILILDDATSALDYQSESIVQEALDKARQGRTTLIVAHRLSTIRNADVICAIQDGRIVEKGTHDELVALQGVYESLISRQTNEDDDDEDEMDEIDLTYDDDGIDMDMGDGIHGPSPIIYEYERQISKLSSRASTRSRASTGRSSTRRRRHASSVAGKPQAKEAVVVEEVSHPAPVSRIISLNKPEMPLIAIGCLAAALQGAIFPAIGFFAAEILGAFGEYEVDTSVINFYVVIFAICGVGAGIATFLMIFLFTTSGERLTLRLRDMAFRSMLRQEIGWFDDRRNQVGSLTSRLAIDASMVKAATGAHLSTVVNASATVLLALALAFAFGWKLALVCTAFVPLLVGTGFAQTALLTNFAKGSKTSMEDGGRIISEAIENIRTVASLTKEEYFFAKLNGHFEKAYSSGLKRAQIFGVTWGISQSMFFYANAASYGYGTYLVAQNEMLYEDVFRVFVSVASGAVELGRVNAFAADYTKAKVSAAKLFALFERKPAIDSSNTKGFAPENCAGEVVFKHVHFRYPTRPEAKVLQGLTVTVKPGQSLALVGSSGCGKSTTVQLLERFYDPEKGQVLVDGNDTTELNITWLRSQMGIVAQEPMLFDATIRENIAYGDQSRQVPDNEIIEAARQANIHEFVSALPNGYDTEIGAKGVALVGGQKQRIAIARALIRNPKILLLDEATSALDTENEKVVQEALDLAQRGRTSIVIAHRLSTIENADVIAVIDNGQVAEVGTHTELMARKGLYYMLQMIQRGVKVEPNGNSEQL